MNIPISWQGDPEKIIGTFESCENEKCYMVTFFKEFNVTHEQFFDAFNCSAVIMQDEWPMNANNLDDDWQRFRIIRKAKIYNFLIGPGRKYNE